MSGPSSQFAFRDHSYTFAFFNTTTMNFQTASEKKKLISLFAVFYGLSAIMLIMIFTVFWNGDSTETVDLKGKRLTTDDQLAQVDDVLHNHLNGIQWLDKKFASLLTDSGMKADFDLTYNQIQHAELAFRKAIDSFDGRSVPTRIIGRYTEIISTYKAALENRKAIDDMQRGIAQGSKQLNHDREALAQLKSNILRKDSVALITSDELKSDKRSDRYAASFPSADYDLLKSENKYLKSELKLLEERISGQRNSKSSLNEARKTYFNMLMEDEGGKSSGGAKIQRASTVKSTGYEGAKDQ